MRTAKIIVFLGILIMSGTLIYASMNGNFRQEGSILLSIPWGIMSLVDLYVGFTLFSGWIVYREQSLLRTVIWILLMMSLGFLAGCVYTFVALQTSGGDWKRFWLGKHWKEEKR
jgi:hypothetical protein